MNFLKKSSGCRIIVSLLLALSLSTAWGCWPQGKADDDAALAPPDNENNAEAETESTDDGSGDTTAAQDGAVQQQPSQEDTLQQRLAKIRDAIANYESQQKPDRGPGASSGNERTGSTDAVGDAPGDQSDLATNSSSGDNNASEAAAGDDDELTLGSVSIVNIRSAATQPAADEADGKNEGAGDAVPTLDALVKHYSNLASKHPDDVDVGRTLRVLQLMAGETAAGLEPVAGLSPADQRLWRGLLWAMANARDDGEQIDPAYRAAQVLAVLDELREDLQDQAPLEIPTVQICRKVASFGSITPLPSDTVRPLDRVSLYTEIRNFSSRIEQDGLHHVRLRQFISLKNAGGKEVWQREYTNIDDSCRTRRQDFFLSTPETIPADLAPGRYVLEVTVEDVVAGKKATGTADVVITAR